MEQQQNKLCRTRAFLKLKLILRKINIIWKPNPLVSTSATSQRTTGKRAESFILAEENKQIDRKKIISEKKNVVGRLPIHTSPDDLSTNRKTNLFLRKTRFSSLSFVTSSEITLFQHLEYYF